MGGKFGVVGGEEWVKMEGGGGEIPQEQCPILGQHGTLTSHSPAVQQKSPLLRTRAVKSI